MSILKTIVGWTGSAALARAQETACYALGLGLALLVLGAAGWAVAVNLYSGPWLVGVIVVATLASSVALTLFSSLGELYGQRARDLRAQAIFERLRNGQPPPPYSLYLRPFASTDAISEGVASTMVGVSGLSLERVELETQIERATRPLGLLVALGAPLEHVGAGRIRVPDEAWQDAIKLLMREARLIVMLPSSRAGTLEEIDMILESGLIERTVLIDPPNLGHVKGYDHAAEWAKVQEAFSAHKFDLPAESSKGALLFYGPERAPALKERLDIDADDRIERLFRRVLKHLKGPQEQAA